MSRFPEVKWAQRDDKVYITILLPDAKNPKVNLEPNGDFTFSATAGADNLPYEFKIELNGNVNVEESKINVGVRNIFCVLEKEEKKWWNKLLRAEGKPPHYVKVDWDKWVDEDEDNGPPADLDLGGMDFSKFGDMGGMGMGGMGMGGMGMGGMGMGGMGLGDDAMGQDFDDSDNEEEISKPQETVASDKIDEIPKVEVEPAEAKASV